MPEWGLRDWREEGQKGRKCYPGNPSAPPRTRIESSEIQIINNNDNEKKKSDGHFLRKRRSRAKLIPQTPLK